MRPPYTALCTDIPSQYVREDSAQAKKSYEDKYGGGAKGAKAAKAAAKEIDDAKAAALAGATADAKDSRGRTASGAKVAAAKEAWSKETDYI